MAPESQGEIAREIVLCARYLVLNAQPSPGKWSKTRDKKEIEMLKHLEKLLEDLTKTGPWRLSG